MQGRPGPRCTHSSASPFVLFSGRGRGHGAERRPRSPGAAAGALRAGPGRTGAAEPRPVRRAGQPEASGRSAAGPPLPGAGTSGRRPPRRPGRLVPTSRHEGPFTVPPPEPSGSSPPRSGSPAVAPYRPAPPRPDRLPRPLRPVMPPPPRSPLCSPRKTSLNFRSGFPNSPPLPGADMAARGGRAGAVTEENETPSAHRHRHPARHFRRRHGRVTPPRPLAGTGGCHGDGAVPVRPGLGDAAWTVDPGSPALRPPAKVPEAPAARFELSPGPGRA